MSTPNAGRGRPLLLAAVILGAVGLRAPAQAGEITACVFPITVLGEAAGVAELGGVVRDALVRNLQVLGVRTLADPEWRPAARARGLADEDLLAGPAAAAVAREVGARMAVSGLVYIEGRQLALSVKVLDPRSARLVTSVYATTILGVTVHNRIAEVVDRLTPRLASFVNPEQDTPEVPPFVLEVTLISEIEGLEVKVGGVESGGRIEEGRLTLPFNPYPVGTRLAVHKEAAGYHSAMETVELDRPRSEIALSPLWPETRSSWHLHWTTGQLFGLGVGYRRYLRPDTSFLEADNYLYLQPSRHPGGELTIHNDLGMVVGRYLLLPYGSPVRFALATGLGVVLTKAPLPGLFTDVYLNLASLILEYNRRTSMLYLRLDTKLALGIGNNLLGTEVMFLERFGPLLTLGLGWKR